MFIHAHQLENLKKVSKNANFRAHSFAKWAITYWVFVSILIRSFILFFIRIKSEKDLLVTFSHFQLGKKKQKQDTHNAQSSLHMKRSNGTEQHKFRNKPQLDFFF